MAQPQTTTKPAKAREPRFPAVRRFFRALFHKKRSQQRRVPSSYQPKSILKATGDGAEVARTERGEGDNGEIVEKKKVVFAQAGLKPEHSVAGEGSRAAEECGIWVGEEQGSGGNRGTSRAMLER